MTTYTITAETAFGPVTSTVDLIDSGWTVFTPSSDTLIVYVAANGNDANDGLSTSTPKLTIDSAKQLMRDGFPDWMLLRRGDTFVNDVPSHNNVFGAWHKSGRSLAEPMVLGTYSTVGNTTRPKIITGATYAAIFTNGSGAANDHLAMFGLELTPGPGYTGVEDCAGIRMLHSGTNFLMEDCYVHGFQNNIIFQHFDGPGGVAQGPDLFNYRVRRCVIADSYAKAPNRSPGMYCYLVHDLLIEDCVFDHNGWNELVGTAGATLFSHNCYIDNSNFNVIVRGNIFSKSSSHGVQLRCGGIMSDNLFLRNSIQYVFGAGNNPEVGGVTGRVTRNVGFEGKNISDPTDQVDQLATTVGTLTGGPWTLTVTNQYGGPFTTTPLAVTATAADIQAALRALANVNVVAGDNVAVSIAGGANMSVNGAVATITWGGSFGTLHATLITTVLDASLVTGGTLSLSIINAGTENLPRGWAMTFANIASALVDWNVSVTSAPGRQPNAINMDANFVGDPPFDQQLFIKNLTIDRNIWYDWAGSIFFAGSAGDYENVVISNNDYFDRTISTYVPYQPYSDPIIQHEFAVTVPAVSSAGNRFFSVHGTATEVFIENVFFTLSFWLAGIGGGDDTSVVLSAVPYPIPDLGTTIDAFVASARLQSFYNWNPLLTAVSKCAEVRASLPIPGAVPQ